MYSIIPINCGKRIGIECVYNAGFWQLIPIFDYISPVLSGDFFDFKSMKKIAFGQNQVKKYL